MVLKISKKLWEKIHKMQSLDSIKEIINKYEVFILDQWGVMHDGNNGYPHAIKCINYLNANNKKLIIISNSSKRKKSSINLLPILGFNSNLFDEVITSGEMIWQAISLSLKEYGDNLKKCFHILIILKRMESNIEMA